MEFKPAQCPSCGGSLQLPDDRTSVNCMYCGGSVIVQEAIQAAVSASVPNLLKLARAAAHSQNHQEAYHYYTKALELDAHHSEAWAGKAESAGSLSSQHAFRIPEMLNYFANSIEAASEGSKTKAKDRASIAICRIITDYYRRMRTALSPAFAEGETWTFYINRLAETLRAVDTAHRLIPDSNSLLRLGIYLCDDNLGHLAYVNRMTRQRASRTLPRDWQNFVSQFKAAYTQKLSPVVESSVERTSVNLRTERPKFTKMTPLYLSFLGVGVLFLFIVLVLIVGSVVENPNPQNSSTALKVDEKTYLNAAGFFFAVQHQQCKQAAAMMASAEMGHTSLKEIRSALEESRSKIAASWQSDYLPVMKKGVPFKFVALDKQLQDLYKLEQSAFDEMLAYWKDRKTIHITTGSDQLKRAAVDSATIAKEITP
jgi:tetratricopeptide (TPR) repeat protein